MMASNSCASYFFYIQFVSLSKYNPPYSYINCFNLKDFLPFLYFTIFSFSFFKAPELPVLPLTQWILIDSIQPASPPPPSSRSSLLQAEQELHRPKVLPLLPPSRGLPPRPPAAGAAHTPPARPSGLLKLETASQRCEIGNFFAQFIEAARD
jgi:hypothetical protein